MSNSERRQAIFHLIFSVPALIVLARFVWPLTLPLWAKGLAAVLVLAASQYHLWSRLSSGSVFSPEFPRPIVMLMTGAFGAILLLAIMMLIIDVASLAVKLVSGRWPAIPDTVRYGLAALAALLAAIGVHNAVRVPPVKDIVIAVRGLPREFDGYRMIQLTDLHISRLFPASWAQAVVARTNALEPDLIVITGDFIDGTLAARRGDVEPLRALSARDGLYAIPGNHEYFFGYENWMRHFADMGMRILPNAHAVLTRGEGRLVLAGVTDLSAPEAGRPGPDLTTALARAPRGIPVILLDHQPKRAREAAARDVTLQLSGHTHGGMIAGLDCLLAFANGGFVSGQYNIDGMTLYVNNGTALWPGFAMRLGRPSELTRITLRRAS